jgi:hypothetical protein
MTAGSRTPARSALLEFGLAATLRRLGDVRLRDVPLSLTAG